MRTFTKWYVVVLLLQVATDLSGQITIAEGHYKIETHSFPVIVCNQFPENIAGTTITLGGTTYTFVPQVAQLKRNTEYNVTHGGVNYRLFFSGIAIVDIHVETGFHTINNNDEIKADISVMDTVGTPYSSVMAIKHRGASSLAYPKKSFRVQLKDENFKNKHESIFGLRTDRRWLMLALYNERLRINNKVSHDLWLDMHKLYYLDREPEALSTIRSRYVLVFMDNVYRGMYLFAEDVDAKQYKLFEDEVNEDDIVYDGGNRLYTGGELYKGETNGPPNYFDSNYPLAPLPQPGSEIWGSWEIKLPDFSDWHTFREFSQYVRDRDQTALQSEIWSSLHKGNFIDYFLFINLVYAEDNLGKNLFMARYKKGEPYFYGVWDLDGTLGYEYDSGRTPRGSGWIDNQLWSKLLAGNADLKDDIAVRWFRLRQNLLSEVQILQRIQKNYDYLAGNAAYKLESIVQERSPLEAEHGGWNREWLNYSSDELNYMKNFMAGRLQNMDDLMEDWLTSPLPVSLISFEASVHEKQVELRWQTSVEVNSDRFEIEHSRDAALWQKLGEVKAAGNADKPLSYMFRHLPDTHGIHYYRLRIVDRDNSQELSDIRSVVFNRGSSVTVFPNPVKGVLGVRAEGGAKLRSLTLLDLLGREVLSKSVVSSNSGYSLSVQGFQGFYLLRTQFEDGTDSVHRVLITK